jgi:hypothetical protein
MRKTASLRLSSTDLTYSVVVGYQRSTTQKTSTWSMETLRDNRKLKLEGRRGQEHQTKTSRVQHYPSIQRKRTTTTILVQTRYIRSLFSTRLIMSAPCNWHPTLIATSYCWKEPAPSLRTSYVTSNKSCCRKFTYNCFAYVQIVYYSLFKDQGAWRLLN